MTPESCSGRQRTTSATQGFGLGQRSPAFDVSDMSSCGLAGAGDPYYSGWNSTLVVEDPSMINYEVEATMALEVVATDTTGLTARIGLSIEIIDTNDPPRPRDETQDRTFVVPASLGIGGYIGVMGVFVFDEDGDPMTYSLMESDPPNVITVDPATGVIESNNPTGQSLTAIVGVSDNRPPSPSEIR